jgi:Gpi18-like mannosyltransferase
MRTPARDWLDDLEQGSFVKHFQQWITAYLRIFQPSTVDASSRWGTWLPLVVILGLAIALRGGRMIQPGFDSDLRWNLQRGDAVYHSGLFNLYRVLPSDYPPLYLSMLGIVGAVQNWLGAPVPQWSVDDPRLLFLLKLFPVAGDLALITVVYIWLRTKPVWRWIIPGVLAVVPGLIIDSAQWGQSDSLMTLLVVLSLIALNRDKPRAAWCFFAIALLIKLQSIVILPLLVVLTYRRCGLCTVVTSILLTACLVGIVLLPFLANSGPATLTPFFGAVGEYPVATANAFNLWYAVTPHKPGMALPWPFDQVSDALPQVGPLSFKHIGLLLMGAYTLLIMIAAWERADDRQEFIWAAGLYFAFFMLPTEIHERYLYPAVVLLIVGIIQDRRAWPLAVGVSLTFTYNLQQVFDQHGLFTLFGIQASLLNLVLLVEVTHLVLSRPASRQALAA